MRISYNWLQTYFKDNLPNAKEVISLFEKHLAEVENIEEKNGDTIFDVNILPDRACYALGHEGIAFELSQLINSKFIEKKPIFDFSDKDIFPVEIENKEFCDRYVAVKISGVDNTTETPQEIKTALENLGQRSINFLVDIANFVMLDVRQPLHIFDVDLVKNKIVVRASKEGENITTLDNREIVLSNEDFVIADDENVLAIAGIKGGKKAESTKQTKNIILESAHFNPVSIRKTSARVGIKTDASKRYENNLSSVYANKGAMVFIEVLKKYQPQVEVELFTDIDVSERKDKILSVSISFIEEKLGINIGGEKCKAILEKMSLGVVLEGNNLTLTIPEYRKDLNIKEDISDEIGRVIGYDAFPVIVPKLENKAQKDKIFNFGNKARNFFVARGFSEIFTHALTDKGDLELSNPLASDKAFMRTNLTDRMVEKLSQNVYYADLLGLSKIKLFEIGKVFKGDREYNSLCVGIAFKQTKKGEKVNDELKSIRDQFVEFFGSKAQTLCTVDDTGGIINLDGKQIGEINRVDGVMELDFDAYIENFENEEIDLDCERIENRMSPVSEFPFMTRDVAVFIEGEKGKENLVFDLIKKEAGELLVRADLFDVFEKTNKETGVIDKTSYGVRLVFQSFKKTLTDEEINPIMDKIYSEMKEKGWEIR